MQRKRSWSYYLLLIGIAAFVIAIGVLRHDETSTDDSSEVSNLASTTFMLICTLGPGVLAKELFARLVPVEQLAKNRRRLRRAIATAEAVQREAIRKREQLHLARDWYREEKDRIHANYTLAYREAGGAVQNPYASVREFPRAQ